MISIFRNRAAAGEQSKSILLQEREQQVRAREERMRERERQSAGLKRDMVAGLQSHLEEVVLKLNAADRGRVLGALLAVRGKVIPSLFAERDGKLVKRCDGDPREFIDELVTICVNPKNAKTPALHRGNSDETVRAAVTAHKIVQAGERARRTGEDELPDPTGLAKAIVEAGVKRRNMRK